MWPMNKIIQTMGIIRHEDFHNCNDLLPQREKIQKHPKQLENDVTKMWRSIQGNIMQQVKYEKYARAREYL